MDRPGQGYPSYCVWRSPSHPPSIYEAPRSAQEQANRMLRSYHHNGYQHPRHQFQTLGPMYIPRGRGYTHGVQQQPQQRTFYSNLNRNTSGSDTSYVSGYNSADSSNGAAFFIPPPTPKPSPSTSSAGIGHSDVSMPNSPSQVQDEGRAEEQSVKNTEVKVSTKLTCTICHVVLIEGEMIDCGHFYCKPCLTKYTESNPGNNICCFPGCGRKYTMRIGSQNLNKFVKDLLDQLGLATKKSNKKVEEATPKKALNESNKAPSFEIWPGSVFAPVPPKLRYSSYAAAASASPSAKVASADGGTTPEELPSWSIWSFGPPNGIAVALFGPKAESDLNFAFDASMTLEDSPSSSPRNSEDADDEAATSTPNQTPSPINTASNDNSQSRSSPPPFVHKQTYSRGVYGGRIFYRGGRGRGRGRGRRPRGRFF